ncbi:aftiphilin-like isoform X2 [Myxocyprinus asiaticus]|uniref:aftiphilin-like isoform X2 n=1 Tax=Myxocyprinus asiaticus TaxID=70543 RepID=UPI002221D6C3|nr:aftiphilin-like isoform X2 [Myxocyprinus asiaticus]
MCVCVRVADAHEARAVCSGEDGTHHSRLVRCEFLAVFLLKAPMEPDVIHMYSSSPPPMEDSIEDDEDEFSDFTGVPNSVSFTEFDTATTFNQSQALNATSPLELLSNGKIMGLTQPPGSTKSNGVTPGCGQSSTPNGRTVNVAELKKFREHQQVHINSLEFTESSRTDNDNIDCNGAVEVLTNGFATLGGGTLPTPHKRKETEIMVDHCLDVDDDYADFSTFSNADHNQTSNENTNWEHLIQGYRPAEDDVSEHNVEEQASLEDDSRDSKITGLDLSGFPSENSEGLSNGDWGFHEGTVLDQRDLETDNAHQDSNTSEVVSTAQPLTLNGVGQKDIDEGGIVDNRVPPNSNGERCRGEQSDEKGSSNETETETETETSFGRPLSTDALEEFGDFSTTGSVPSPPPQEETATPTDHSQLAEDDDEDFGDFGDFGDASSLNATGFADFDQQGATTQVAQPESHPIAPKGPVEPEEDEFGDFDTSRDPSKTGLVGEEGMTFADCPSRDSFADFSSAHVGNADDNGRWQAFSEPNQIQDGGDSWATFGQEYVAACTEKTGDDWHESQLVPAPPTGSAEERKSCTTAALVCRLEKIFQATFQLVVAPQEEDEVHTLNAFLKPPDRSEQEAGSRETANGALQDVWQQLQDVNNAYSLRYQWGGSYTNKALLCSLGIDTRNILFTGHKRQPLIVPVYAASLGMLEPTKEPVKPVSAVELIASIAQSPPFATELNTCPPDTTQESLPPVQFDWSSSGLTNPLDASGGSSLLNLDFFGPVDESPSGTATSIPGVDPELYELTQAKLVVSRSSSRVVDAFARLMLTVEKTSTSTRKPLQKEENLSEEARGVITGLPDLSFMQAKVLMFPSMLTPLLPSASPTAD